MVLPLLFFVEIAGVVEVIIPTMAALNASSGIHQLGNIISLLKKAYSMQRFFTTIEMNTQIIIVT